MKRCIAVAMGVLLLAGAARGQLASGVTLNFVADDPASGVDGNNWNSLTADSGQNMDFGGDVTLQAVSSPLSTLTKAYRFTGGNGDGNQGNWNGKYGDGVATTWEFWVKPADTGDAGQTLLESGGAGTGYSVWYAPGATGDGSGTIRLTIDGGNVQNTVNAVIDTTDFRHVTFVYDRDYSGSTDLMQVYVDGEFVDDNLTVTSSDDGSNDSDDTGLNDFCGGDNGGVGYTYNSLAQTAVDGEFEGDIAILRVWGSKALTAGEIYANFALRAILDSDPPVLGNLSPTNGATGVSPGANFVATFDEPIYAGTGNVIISNLMDATTIVIPIGDSQVSMSDSNLIINPTNPLGAPTNYAVLIDDGAVEDEFGNAFTGITSAATWAFTTFADTAAPVLLSLSPENGELEALTTDDLVLTFDENIVTNPGTLTISNLTDGTGIEIPMGDPQISISGPVMTINQSNDFIPIRSYAVLLSAGAVADEFGNTFAGITSVSQRAFDTTGFDGTWAVDAGGDWSDTGNWVDGVLPLARGSVATFPNIITADRTVTLDVDTDVGTLVFADTSHHLTISGGKWMREMATRLGVPEDEPCYNISGRMAKAFDAGEVSEEDFTLSKVGHDRFRLELMFRFGYYVTESSEHSLEYVPWAIRPGRDDLVEQYIIPVDEYPRRCREAIAKWEKQREALFTDAGVTHAKASKEFGAFIMDAIERDAPYRIAGNVMNDGLITNLPRKACVEVPCLVDRNGVQPTVVGELPEQCAALNRTNINPQIMTMEAALSGKRDYIYQAALLDPHTSAVLSIDETISLCDDMIAAHGDWLPAFRS